MYRRRRRRATSSKLQSFDGFWQTAASAGVNWWRHQPGARQTRVYAVRARRETATKLIFSWTNIAYNLCTWHC